MACTTGSTELAEVRWCRVPTPHSWQKESERPCSPQRGRGELALELPVGESQGEAGPTGAATASFSGCASAAGPRLRGSGLRPLPAGPRELATPFLGPWVSRTARRFGRDLSVRACVAVRFLLEAWPGEAKRKDRGLLFPATCPPPLRRRGFCWTRGPFPQDTPARGPRSCEDAHGVGLPPSRPHVARTPGVRSRGARSGPREAPR